MHRDAATQHAQDRTRPREEGTHATKVDWGSRCRESEISDSLTIKDMVKNKPG